MALGIKIPSSVPPERIYKYTRFIESRRENGKMFNCYLVLKRTSELNSKEMAHLIDMTIQEARELGIETETPRELEEMKRRWAEYEAAHPRKE